MQNRLFISKNGDLISIIHNVKEVQSKRLWDDPFSTLYIHHVIGEDGKYKASICVGCDWELR